MKMETCLELQAHLDGELPPGRREAVQALCAQDAEAQALYQSLKTLRETVRDHEPEHRLSESREFYWSQIQRRIASAEAQAAPAPQTLSAWSQLFRWLVPLGGLAAVALIFTLKDPARPRNVAFNTAPNPATSVEYRSDADGVTVHWIN